MGVVGRGVLLLVASALACGSAPPQAAPAKPPVRSEPQKAAVLAAPSTPSELERLLLEAQELEARGVADVAARRFVCAYNISRNDRHLVEAARLYELAWNHEAALGLLERLARNPEHASFARQHLAQLPVAVDFSPEQVEQTEALLAQAQQQLEASDTDRARASVQAAGEVAWTTEVLRALSTLDWKAGNKPAAQLGWSRVRSTRGMETATAELSVVPTLSWGNDDLAISVAGVGGWGLRAEPPLLQFATANGDIFGYSLEWATFARLGESLLDPWQLVADRRGPIRATTSLAPRALAFSDAKLPTSMADVVARAASADGLRVAFVNSRGELWLLAAKPHVGLEQVFHGELTERGRPLSLSMYPSLLLHAGAGKGERLYLAADRTVAMSRSEVGEVLELSLTGAVLRKWQAHQQKLSALAITRDSRYLATSSGAEVKVWDLSSLRAVWAQRLEGGAVPFLSFHPSDDVLELGQEFRVQSLDWRNGRLLGSRETGETLSLVHSRDGRYSATVLARSGDITFARDRGGEQRRISGALSSRAQLSDDKQRLLVSGPALWLFQLQPWSAKQLRAGPAWRTALSPDGKLIAFWAEQRVEVVDASGKRRWSIDVPKEPESLTFADDRLAVGDGKTLAYFDLPRGRKVAAQPGREQLRLHNGSLLVAGDRVIHSISDPPGSRKLAGDRAFVNHARSAFVVGDRQGRSITVYDARGRQLAQAKDMDVPSMMALSDDGASVIASFTHPSYALWHWDLRADTWRQIEHGVHAGFSGVSSLTFLDTTLISGGADGIVTWDMKSGARGSLNLLEDGSWFSLAHTQDFNAVDGTPEAIDHVVNGPYLWHPGSVWEGLRHTGSFGQLLRGLPLPALADFPAE